MYRVDDMPYNGCTWTFYPSTENAKNADGTANDADNVGREVAAAWENSGEVATCPARYFLNGGRIQMNCSFLNYPGTIPVLYRTVADDGTIDYDSENTVLVHNYHNIATELDAANYMMLYTPGARIYIKDVEGWKDFVKYCKRSDPDVAGTTDPDVQMEIVVDNVGYSYYPDGTTDADGNPNYVPVTAALVKKITNAQYGVNAYPWYCEGLKFYLQDNIDLSDADPDEVCIANKFLGQLDGDGYHVILPKQATALFTNTGSVTGNAYNLVVVGGKTGLTNENCLENASASNADDDELYGKTAYEMSHYYSIAGRADGTATDYANTDRYAGDDWQYARANIAGGGYNGDKRYLRTGEPNLQSTTSNHDTSHTTEEVCPHDYRFFGQSLQGETGTAKTPGSDIKHETYPQHLDDEHDQYVSTYTDDDWTESNRVWGAEGFYQSMTDNGFYYNRDAWVLNHKTTAVKLIDHTYDAPATLTSFNVENDDDNSSINAAGVTKNLLVYNTSPLSDGTNGIFFDAVKLAAADINGSNYAVGNLALYDKEDFNAPLKFTATTASYVRDPSTETGYVNQRGQAWASVCLPFTVATTTLSDGITRYIDAIGYGSDDEQQTDISFFYGEADTDNSADPYKQQNDLNHEYWLRQITDVTTGTGAYAGKTVANFYRPAKGIDDGGFKAYTPFVASFPGTLYREFDMTDQTVTFSAEEAVVAVTDEATKYTAAGAYYYNGAFINEEGTTGKYAIKLKSSASDDTAIGDRFDDGERIYPFRGYLATTAASKSMAFTADAPLQTAIDAIYITDIYSNNEQMTEEQDDDSAADEGITIYSLSGGRLGITSAYDTTINVYTTAGQLVRVLDIRQGKQTFSGFKPAVYLVGNKKVMVR